MLMTTEGERIQPRPRKNAQIVTDVEDLHFENVTSLSGARRYWGGARGRGSRQTEYCNRKENGEIFFFALAFLWI